MSYFAFLNNLPEPNPRNVEIIQGLCQQMCPEEEANLRIREKLLHALERNGPEQILVKSFSRSAADTNMAKPHLLRPFPVLKKTVDYLLNVITKNTKVSTPTTYDFINDRLRAIRQDMTIQRLPNEQCLILLEPMIKFHVYFGYKLSECDKNTFDPVLNRKYLLEAILWYLSCCNQIENNDDICYSFSQVKLDKGAICKPNRALIESLYILSNLDYMQPLHRYLKLEEPLKRHPTLLLSYKIGVANLTRNYIKMHHLAKDLELYSKCAYYTYLPIIYKKHLEILSVAFNSQQLRVPTDAMVRWLSLRSEEEAKQICTHYGFNIDEKGVLFRKIDFKIDSLCLNKKFTEVEDII